MSGRLGGWFRGAAKGAVVEHGTAAHLTLNTTRDLVVSIATSCAYRDVLPRREVAVGQSVMRVCEGTREGTADSRLSRVAPLSQEITCSTLGGSAACSTNGHGLTSDSRSDSRSSRAPRRIASRGILLSVSSRTKLLTKILSGTSSQNISFDDLVDLLQNLGFAMRISGSHRIFSREG